MSVVETTSLDLLRFEIQNGQSKVVNLCFVSQQVRVRLVNFGARAIRQDSVGEG